MGQVFLGDDTALSI